MNEEKYECLKLSNQLCFPLYVCSKEIVRRYKPFLDKVDLTYTQYITMMAFWEVKEANVKDLGKMLFLDSGTLTPVLKTLESKGLITRERSKEDERNLIVKITQKGTDLRENCLKIPEGIGGCVDWDVEKAKQLKMLLDDFLRRL